MSARVLELDAYRPHTIIDTRPFDGRMNVAPLAWLRDWASGKDTTPPTEAELRVIVGEWLCCLEAGVIEQAVEALGPEAS